MRPKTIGYYKAVKNDGTCDAQSDMRVGNGVVVDFGAKTATLPTSASEAQTIIYMVTNIHDRPEMIHSDMAEVVFEGQKVRVDDLTSVANLTINLSQADVTTDLTTLALGDQLVFGATGVIEKASSVSGYAVYFEVVEIGTVYGGGYGIVAQIKVA